MKDSYPQERLFSLDLLRGLDMMFLTVAGPLLMATNAVWGLPACVMRQLSHPWVGFTCWDIIMPMFIFMCGAAIPFALERRLAKNDGKANAAYWKHVLGRVALLWCLGLLVQGRIATFNWNQIRLFDNTLETIAVGYLAVACAILIPNKKIVMAIPIACFVIYGVLLHFLGDYSLNGNFASIVEQGILVKIVPATSETMKEIVTYGVLADQSTIPARVLQMGVEIHYTWYLTSLMFVFMTFCGYYATKILLAEAAQWTKAKRLFAYGAAMLAIGWILKFCGVEMVKHVFTVSFTAQAMGWSALFLAVLYVLTDICKFRRGLGVVILFGQFALWAYMIEEYFKPAAVKLAEMLLGGVPNLIGTAKYQPIILALAVVAEIILALMIRRRIKEKR